MKKIIILLLLVVFALLLNANFVYADSAMWVIEESKLVSFAENFNDFEFIYFKFENSPVGGSPEIRMYDCGYKNKYAPLIKKLAGKCYHGNCVDITVGAVYDYCRANFSSYNIDLDNECWEFVDGYYKYARYISNNEKCVIRNKAECEFSKIIIKDDNKECNWAYNNQYWLQRDGYYDFTFCNNKECIIDHLFSRMDQVPDNVRLGFYFWDSNKTYVSNEITADFDNHKKYNHSITQQHYYQVKFEDNGTAVINKIIGTEREEIKKRIYQNGIESMKEAVQSESFGRPYNPKLNLNEELMEGYVFNKIKRLVPVAILNFVFTIIFELLLFLLLFKFFKLSLKNIILVLYANVLSLLIFWIINFFAINIIDNYYIYIAETLIIIFEGTFYYFIIRGNYLKLLLLSFVLNLFSYLLGLVVSILL